MRRYVALLWDHENTILHILGTEILGLFQIDLLSNFMLELTTEHIPALSESQFCCFLAFWKLLILKDRKFSEKEKINFVNAIIEWLQSYFMWLIPIYQVTLSRKDLVYLLLKKCLDLRLSDFLSVIYLPGISVPEPKSYFKFQKFTSNEKKWGVKLHDGFKSTCQKIALLFWISKKI